MSNTAFGTISSATLLGRLLSQLDRLLMASAWIAVRNGDMPHIGL